MTRSNVESKLAEEGERRIRWASDSMPVLRETAEALKKSGGVSGKRIGLCLPLDAKIANLALILIECGATVSCWSPIQFSDTHIVHALTSRGITVFVNNDSESSNAPSSGLAFLATNFDYLLDYDAQGMQLLCSEQSELLNTLKGVTELTKTGIDHVSVLCENAQMSFPVIDLHSTKLNRLFNNTIGTGQSAVMAMLDITNLQIAGRRILVIGYGQVGKGVASHAAAMGAKVTVAEIDPIKAVHAHYDGHTVDSVSNAAIETEVVFTTTGAAGALSQNDLDAMPTGVIVCAAGCGQAELPLQYLEQAVHKESVRAHVTEFQLASGKTVLLMADGHCINTAAGEGTPIETADKLLALQLKALTHLFLSIGKDEKGVCCLPVSYEKEIASSFLHSDKL